MKSKTPKKTGSEEQDLSNFIAGAEEKTENKADFSLPWEDPNVRDDVTKVFNLRLSERHFLMLKFLAEHQKRESMQSICLDAIEPMLERESLELVKKLSKR